MISCICITYSRVELLEESIQSFLNQSFKGEKELIILNDCDDQILEFNHPEVFVLNCPRRFNTIGEKRNVAMALAKGDLLTQWDDDDIHLPHALEYCHDKIQNNALDYYKLNEAFFYSQDNGISKTTVNQMYGCAMYTKRLYVKTGGHGFINSGQDTYIEGQFKTAIQKEGYKSLIENTNTNTSLDKKDIYYVYRWGGISYHLSLTGKDPNALEIIKDKRKESEPNRKTGHIQLTPHWNKNYPEIVSNFLEKAENP